MITITVLINDKYHGTPNPLIYTVEVDNPEDHDEVLEAVTEARMNDLGGTEDDELELELLVAFPGPIHPISDWRG
jgi:hypothetical protein